MPLHAITSMYGEAGLGQRLLIEIADLPAADPRRADSACSLMSLVHAGDRRQHEPYANHPLRVAIRILSHYRVIDPDVACARRATTYPGKRGQTAFRRPLPPADRQHCRPRPLGNDIPWLIRVPARKAAS
jgi:hypothetical protein